MTPRTSTTDNLALTAICGHWLERACAANHLETMGDCPTGMAQSLAGVDIQDRSITADGGFELGFAMAMQTVAAILRDPLGNPLPDILAAAADARETLAALRRDHAPTNC
jgi:hypothetical protein